MENLRGTLVPYQGYQLKLTDPTDDDRVSMGPYFGQDGFANELALQVLEALVEPTSFTTTMRNVSAFGRTCRYARGLTCDPLFLAYIFNNTRVKGASIPPQLYAAYVLRASQNLRSLALPNDLPGWTGAALKSMLGKHPKLEEIDTRDSGMGTVSVTMALEESPSADNIKALHTDDTAIVLSDEPGEQSNASSSSNTSPPRPLTVLSAFRKAKKSSSLLAMWHTVPPRMQAPDGTVVTAVEVIDRWLQKHFSGDFWKHVQEWPALYSGLGGDIVLTKFLGSEAANRLTRLTLPDYLTQHGYTQLKGWDRLPSLEYLEFKLGSEEEATGPMLGADRRLALKAFFSELRLPKLTQLVLPPKSYDDGVLAAVAKACPNLTQLTITQAPHLTAQGFENVIVANGFAKVEKWTLHRCPNIAPTLIKVLGTNVSLAAQMRQLSLSDSGNLDPAVKVLTQDDVGTTFPQCRNVTVSNAFLSSHAVSALCKLMPNVVYMNVSGNTADDTVLSTLTQAKKLQHLVLTNNPNISAKGLSALRQLMSPDGGLPVAVQGDHVHVHVDDPKEFLQRAVKPKQGSRYSALPSISHSKRA